jgi:hypothetical protein
MEISLNQSKLSNDALIEETIARSKAIMKESVMLTQNTPTGSVSENSMPEL